MNITINTTSYSPSDLLDDIRNDIITKFDDVCITGEIMSIKNNIHTYITLTDESTNINCVIWKNSKAAEQTKDDLRAGSQICITGRISIYSKSCQLTVSISKINVIGTGTYVSSHEKIFNECQLKGYFNRKRLLPRKINTIGIITAQTGAAVQDMLYVCHTKRFTGTIYIKDSIMQGPKCPQSIINGIEFFENTYPNIDVLILARGGGSFEDLVGFNSIEIIEKISKCNIYIISAIGHETDTMLTDHVANYRAPTPSIAAEVICESNSYIRREIEEHLIDVDVLLTRLITSTYNRIDKHITGIYEIHVQSNFEIIMSFIDVIIDKLVIHTNKSLTVAHNVASNVHVDQLLLEPNAIVIGSLDACDNVCNNVIEIFMNGKMHKLSFVLL